MIRSTRISWILALAWMLISCGSDNTSTDDYPALPADRILAKVGDRIITVDEFIRRAEYTIRPPYCRGDNAIHKKIILNSLIAEKLLALENENADLNEDISAYLKGRREQKMRDVLFFEKAYSKVKIDTAKINATAFWGERTYEIQYLSLRDTTMAKGMQEALESGLSFEEICYDLLNLKTIPSRTVEYQTEMDPVLADVLFSQEYEKGSIIGPVKALDGTYLVIKILGWTRKVRLSPSDKQAAYNEVQEKWITDRAGMIYNQYVHEIMRGKRMTLVEDTFTEFADVVMEHYLTSQKKKEEMVQMTLWEQEQDQVYPDVKTGTVFSPDMPLLELDGDIWDLREIETLIRSHPIVFRDKKISEREFPQQLKYAIADLIRDHFLNEAAYEAGYDQHPTVKQEELMWQDSHLSNIKTQEYPQQQGFHDSTLNNYSAA
ncbi:MAG: hypothetical protein H8D46_02365, partial [FCB group bacterium]|nr:hypothetical protein [FCB group bacterium]